MSAALSFGDDIASVAARINGRLPAGESVTADNVAPFIRRLRRGVVDQFAAEMLAEEVRDIRRAATLAAERAAERAAIEAEEAAAAQHRAELEAQPGALSRNTNGRSLEHGRRGSGWTSALERGCLCTECEAVRNPDPLSLPTEPLPRGCDENTPGVLVRDEYGWPIKHGTESGSSAGCACPGCTQWRDREQRHRVNLARIFNDYRASLRMEWTADLLNAGFALPDGSVVLWGDATVGQHELRRDMLLANASANAAAAGRHEAAIVTITSSNGETLRQATDPTAGKASA